MTDSQPTSGTQKIGFCHMALKFNFKVTWTPQTIMIEEKPNSERFTQSVVFGVCGVCALFLTSIPHMWKIPHIFLTLKFIAKNDLLYFLTFSDVRKGFPHISPAHLQFPHILDVWNWLQRISSHFSTHSSEPENQMKSSLHFSNVWNALFLTSIPHVRKIPYYFLTFSSHFPHIEIS